MDLYIQVGVLLVFASMFALVMHFYSQSSALGREVGESLAKPSVNYSMDSSITTSSFLVDSRVFNQWAVNAIGQRELYLMYPSIISPNRNEYGAYLDELDVHISPTDPSDRRLTIKPKTDPNMLTANAFLVAEQSPKVISYIREFATVAKVQGTDSMISVYTFTDSSTGKVTYVCYIE